MTNTLDQLPDVWRMWLVNETLIIPVVKRKQNKLYYAFTKQVSIVEIYLHFHW